jgi:DNA-binding MarR family transcriptional regulator
MNQVSGQQNGDEQPAPNVKRLDPESLAVIDGYLHALHQYQSIRRTISAQEVVFLLHVAKEEGQTLVQLSRASEIPVTTMTRYHHLLSRRYGRKSHGLIHGFRSMQDSRRLQVVLTPDGHQFFQRLQAGEA